MVNTSPVRLVKAGLFVKMDRQYREDVLTNEHGMIIRKNVKENKALLVLFPIPPQRKRQHKRSQQQHQLPQQVSALKIE